MYIVLAGEDIYCDCTDRASGVGVTGKQFSGIKFSNCDLRCNNNFVSETQRVIENKMDGGTFSFRTKY